MTQAVLADVLDHGLLAVIVGNAVGNESAAKQMYYAKSGNHFWPVLRVLGLVPGDFRMEDWKTLTRWGIELTDLIKDEQGPDTGMRTATRADIETFIQKLQTYAPQLIAFNGSTTTAPNFYRQYNTISGQHVPLNSICPGPFGQLLNSEAWILESSSPSNNEQWKPKGNWRVPEGWQKFAERMKGLKAT
jgi:TDG/mug DNA glycosylase family protein